MGNFDHFMVLPEKPDEDFMRITPKGKVAGYMRAFKFIDRDTKLKMMYVPSLDLSGYGESYEQAEEMLKFSLDQLFEYLTGLSKKKVEAELVKMGWKQKLFNKQYSKAYVDTNGELQNLNAENDKVEVVLLTAA